MKLEDWLDDLCVRFIINLPPEELESVERICFQVEEAQWFYEDFIRPLDPSLPSLSLRAFSLRIFQHCPLFSEWSAENYTAAFAEFLAYKSRVPVRGAVMLNEEMDKVILVKGWKKGANWSFPRGKINKDEDDLDCAIREVYEETGFDLQAARLVKDAKEMKYIEVTMREQHMRLYVFRGVPMDTYFEPRTRKEISRIEWYNLNDLPTLTRNKQHEGMYERLANANKFYMVAPFLAPLKKWIAQQRKIENRMSSHTYGPTPALAEEPSTEHESYQIGGLGSPRNTPSDLPEVSQPHGRSIDPSLQLKQILNIEKANRIDSNPDRGYPEVDTAKSSALLALLRQGSRPDVDNGPNVAVPFDEISIPSDAPKSPHPFHAGKSRLSSRPPPSQFVTVAHLDERPAPGRRLLSPALEVVPPSAQSYAPLRVPAPYQRTGDPQFSESQFGPSQGSRVPPASALPPLTNHARSLLDVFKRDPVQNLSTIPPVSPTYPPLHIAAPPHSGHPSHTTVPTSTSTDPFSLLPTLLAQRERARIEQADPTHAAPSNRRANLLNLFTTVPSSQAGIAPSESTARPALSPVELAASAASEPEGVESSQTQLLAELLAQRSLQSSQSERKVHDISSVARTAATVSVPTNQPRFDGIAQNRGRSGLTNGPARSLVPQHRTLFDPKQGMQKRILTRVTETGQSPTLLPRPKQAANTPSPNRTQSRHGGDSKPIQRQILRRPVADLQETPTRPIDLALAQFSEKISLAPTSPPSQSPPHESPPQQHHQHKPRAETHKQTLLSLFGNPKSPELSPNQFRPRPSVSPPVLASGMVSPLAERTIITRSHRGSLASIVSASHPLDGHAVPEKRQTAANDKAFLLGYLGRIATQEV